MSRLSSSSCDYITEWCETMCVLTTCLAEAVSAISIMLATSMSNSWDWRCCVNTRIIIGILWWAVRLTYKVVLFYSGQFRSSGISWSLHLVGGRYIISYRPTSLIQSGAVNYLYIKSSGIATWIWQHSHHSLFSLLLKLLECHLKGLSHCLNHLLSLQRNIHSKNIFPCEVTDLHRVRCTGKRGKSSVFSCDWWRQIFSCFLGPTYKMIH